MKERKVGFTIFLFVLSIIIKGIGFVLEKIEDKFPSLVKISLNYKRENK